ncbi:DUF1015 family protein [Membranihabitans marinus]|uniref:DUF1015 family protein n=1 Tax=Membranihabitans marinus TaxID=1227546 RepID=UPI001F46570E|nr:DUF1015 family protein [Membranihabitans marinus]
MGRIQIDNCMIHGDLWRRALLHKDRGLPSEFYLVIQMEDKVRTGKSLGFIGIVDYQNLSSIWPHEDTMEAVVEKKKMEFLKEGNIEKPILVIYPRHALIYHHLQRGLEEGGLVYCDDTESCQTQLFLPHNPSWQNDLETLMQEIDHGVIADGHHRMDAFKSMCVSQPDMDIGLPVVWMDFDQITVYSFYRNLDISHELAEEFWFYLLSLADVVEGVERWKAGIFYCQYNSVDYLMRWKSHENNPSSQGYRDILFFQNTLLDGWNKEYSLYYNNPFFNKTGSNSYSESAKDTIFVFQFYPISPQELFRAVKEDIVLPPKSTYFLPRISKNMIRCNLS